MKKNKKITDPLTRLQQASRAWLVTQLAQHRHRALAPITPAEFYQARRILILRVDGIGDTLMTLPAVRLLRRLNPDTQVDALVRPCSKPLLDELTVFDQVHLYEHKRATPATRGEMGQSFLALRRQLHQQHYDMVIEIAGLPKSRRLAYHAGAKRLISPQESHYEGERAARFERVPSDLIALNRPLGHPTDNFIRLIEQLAGTTAPIESKLTLPERTLDDARHFLSAQGLTKPFVVVHPLSSDAHRNWELRSFVPVINHLTERHGLHVLLTGSDRDTDTLAALRNQLACPKACTLAPGSLSILELAGVCQLAELVVCVDTVTMHLADGVGAPLVGLMLPWYWLNYPYHQPDSALIAPGNQPHYTYMRRPADAKTVRYIDRITVEQVIDKVDQQLDKPARYPARASVTSMSGLSRAS